MQDKTFRERYGPWGVVTGATDGMGRACAQELAAKGLHLVLVARRVERLIALANTRQAAHGVQVRVVAADLSTDAGHLQLMAGVADLEVGLLVAAAGHGSAGPLLDQSLDNELDMVHVNVRAVLAQVWHLGRAMKARGHGGVVLFGSLLGFHGTPGSANYAATKAYVQSLAEALHVEWRPHGVDVLSCAPGPVHTGFAARARMQMAQAADPQAVARATLKALGRQSTVRPGWLAKVLGWSLGTAPRGLRVRIMGQIMQGMTADRGPA